MRVLLAVAVVLFLCLLAVIAERALRAVRRGLRRRDANERLAAAAARAEADERQRQAVAEASSALTSLMPTIHDVGPRHVDLTAVFPVITKPFAPKIGVLPFVIMESMRVVVLSDTHAPRRWRTCPPRVAEHLRGADLILHAGDVCAAAVLDELAQYAPVRAVAGNNDGPDVTAWGAREAAELDIGGLRVAMLHDSGPAANRLARMRRAFPAADLVVFGHSHIPLDASGYGLRIFNPGSPTDRRRQPAGTIGVLRIEEGHLAEATIIAVT